MHPDNEWRAWDRLMASGLWSQRVGGYCGLPALARQLGVDPVALLAANGLAPEAFDHPDGRVPYAALAATLDELTRRSGCEHAGLLAGRMWNVADFGVVGALASHAPTVGDALRALTQHSHLVAGGGLMVLVQRGDLAELGYAIYHPDVRKCRAMLQSALAIVASALRELCGPEFAPVEALFPLTRPRDTTPYRLAFMARTSFDADRCAIRFPRAWLQAPLAGRGAVRGMPQELPMRFDDGDIVDWTVRALRTLLAQGSHGGDDVAAFMSIHRRTLNRRLNAAGTTFREVLDRTRFDLARQLLGESDISLDDVAATLGYAGVSPFMRTFRRWSGTTPARWRRGARAAARATAAGPATAADAVPAVPWPAAFIDVESAKRPAPHATR
jgi:AraC-like DNA-binding protein